MALNLSDAKRLVQDHLQEGLLLVVGTGLSCAEGLPGMGALGDHLKRVIPTKFQDTPDPSWEKVARFLDAGDNLETAMGKVTLREPTVDAIVAATSDLVSRAEKTVFQEVMSGTRTLPFTRFVTHLFKAGQRFHLITSNYDRLIELATEIAGIGVDSRLFGYLHGRPDAKRSACGHIEIIPTNRRTFIPHPLPCLSIYKPHGSLDWYAVDGKLVRCPVDTGRTPLIITPGASKYRESFRRVFDEQRSAGNKAVTRATRLMFIGYGFNDYHLEQYLCPDLKLAKPTVIVTKHLSSNARDLIANSRNTSVLAFSAVSDSDLRTLISSSNGEELIVAEPLWNLSDFNRGVL